MVVVVKLSLYLSQTHGIDHPQNRFLIIVYSRGGHKYHYIKIAAQQSAAIFSTSKSAVQNAQYILFF